MSGDLYLRSESVARVGKGDGDVRCEFAHAPHGLVNASGIPRKEALRIEQEQVVAEISDSVGHDLATEVVAASEPDPRRGRADNAWTYHRVFSRGEVKSVSQAPWADRGISDGGPKST